MGRRDNLVRDLASELNRRTELDVDEALLGAIIDGCGPAVYGAGEAYVRTGNPDDRQRILNNFLGKKLAMRASAELEAAIDEAMEYYGDPGPEGKIPKPAVYYLLVVQLGRRDAFQAG